MDNNEKREIFRALLDIMLSLRRLVKAIGMDEKIVDAIYELEGKKDREIELKMGKVIEQVNKKNDEIDRLADLVISSEIQFDEKDKEKIKTLLKMLAVCKIAGISEYKFSQLVKNNGLLLEKLGKINARNLYHAMKYTTIWKYRYEVYKLFGIEENVVEDVKCIYCGGSNIIKVGRRATSRGRKQRYYCKTCSKSFVPKRDKEYVVYDKKWKELAGKLYCDVEKNLFLDDVVKIIKNDHSLNVSSATISKWIDDFVKENLQRLTQPQKQMLLIKKVVEKNGYDVSDIVKTIKEKWGYKVTHIKMMELIASYRKIKDKKDEIIRMAKEGIKISAIAEYFRVNKDMLMLMLERGLGNGEEKEEQ